MKRYTRSLVKRTRKIRNAVIAGAILFAVAGVIMQGRTARVKNAGPNTTATAQLMQVHMDAAVPQQIIEYNGFTVNFNREHHVPNYVVWELTAQKAVGNEKRSNRFAADPNVKGCATLADYKGSGFDRGHMAPAADMKWSRQAMKDCFMLSNMAPQTSRLNSGRWNDLENRTRLWAQTDSQLIVICGPVLTDRITKKIGHTGVSVPSRFFKIIYAPHLTPPQMIAFVFSNTALPETIKNASCSVDQIEEMTGMDFFNALPDSLENALESTNNYSQWIRTHRK